MPLLYREGKKAFYRLQLEIIKNSSDESVFAWGQDTNIIPKPALSWHYGLLDENLGAFERYGDIVDEFSFRRPYTMTNKGFQVMANLISPREYLARTKVEGEDRRYPKWVLTLHCHRRDQGSKSLAICLIEGEEGLGWARVSDSLLSSYYSENWATIAAHGFERRQIIIQAEPAKYEATPTPTFPGAFTKDPCSFLIDARSVMKCGYSICAQTTNSQTLDFGKDGLSLARFESLNTSFRCF